MNNLVMAELHLPAHLLSVLEQLIEQARFALPQAPTPPDFSASAFIWAQQQLSPVYEPRQIHLDDLLLLILF